MAQQERKSKNEDLFCVLPWVHSASPSPVPTPVSHAPATLNLPWRDLYRRSDLSPHLALAVRGWHEVRGRSLFSGKKLWADHKPFIIHSSIREADPFPKPMELVSGQLFFQLPDGVLVALTYEPVFGSRLTLWAPDFEQAQAVYKTLREKYAVAAKRSTSAPVFYVLKSVGEDVGVQPIAVPQQYRQLWRRKKPGGGTYTTDEWLALHYGPDFPVWHQHFVAGLRARPAGGGLTLLRGEPGTGKSTYLRFLLAELRRTHRFYYLPANAFQLLTSPSMADFWLQEGKDHLGRGGRVVILEDAERLLMERAADNRDALSNLLNLADGFLGDALQLHVIATVNCPLERIDPALLRPGRLTASHAFARLSTQQAQALAAAENLSLPVATSKDQTYSLAELYRSATVATVAPTTRTRRVGFHG